LRLLARLAPELTYSGFQTTFGLFTMFHISVLEPATPNSISDRVQSLPPSVEINGETEYKISEILDSKINQCRKPHNLLYLVHWAGYEGTDKETSWVLVTGLSHSAKIVTDFYSAYPAKPGPWVP
jgi:hypothetical protein